VGFSPYVSFISSRPGIAVPHTPFVTIPVVYIVNYHDVVSEMEERNTLGQLHLLCDLYTRVRECIMGRSCLRLHIIVAKNNNVY
jgi:hypothetical protein